MKRFGALFDLDGVLVDSENQYTIFWDGIERRFPTGIPDYAVAIKGRTLTTILDYYPTEEIKRQVVDELYKFEASMPYPLMKGVTELLSSMRSQGWATAIVTSSDSEKMKRLFKATPELKPFFDVIIDGSMVARSKPDPQGYLMAAEAIGYDPTDCFVFEDSLQGVAAGRASGATVVGLATTFPRQRIEQTGCTDIIVSSLDQLNTDVLRKLKTI
ncbi:MAG: HAD family phosphatase [Paramuribaculum sp.]|nr:HAD family phosphatase [Paramuribaculum sp.]